PAYTRDLPDALPLRVGSAIGRFDARDHDLTRRIINTVWDHRLRHSWIGRQLAGRASTRHAPRQECRVQSDTVSAAAGPGAWPAHQKSRTRRRLNCHLDISGSPTSLR